MNYASIEFYQLHFQIRKNISTSKRFQKRLSLGQQTLPPGRRGLDLLSCWVSLGSLAARVWNPGNQQAPGLAPQIPHCHSATSLTALPSWKDVFQQLFSTRGPEVPTLGFGTGFPSCKPTSETSRIPQSIMTHQEQPPSWDRAREGLLAVPSGFIFPIPHTPACRVCVCPP